MMEWIVPSPAAGRYHNTQFCMPILYRANTSRKKAKHHNKTDSDLQNSNSLSL